MMDDDNTCMMHGKGIHRATLRLMLPLTYHKPKHLGSKAEWHGARTSNKVYISVYAMAKLVSQVAKKESQYSPTNFVSTFNIYYYILSNSSTLSVSKTRAF